MIIQGNSVEKKYNPATKRKPHKDIYVTKTKTIVTYENGCRVERQVKKEVNITKMMNESKKLVKQNTAQEKLNEIEKIFSQEGKA
jgi:hypothetical protein